MIRAVENIFGEGGQRRLIPLEVAFSEDRCAHDVHVRATHARAQVIDGYSAGGIALACANNQSGLAASERPNVELSHGHAVHQYIR